MPLTEFQYLASFCTGLALSVCFGLAIYVKIMNRNLNYPFSAKVARFVLAISIFFEMTRGILHLLFPYKSHTVISGLAEGFDVRHDENAMAVLALVTHQLGTVNIILTFTLMIPFLVNDSSLRLTTYMLSVKLIVQLLSHLNISFSIFNDIKSFMPNYLQKSYQTIGTARKSPPGIHLHFFELALLTVGIISAVAAQRCLKKESGKDQ